MVDENVSTVKVCMRDKNMSQALQSDAIILMHVAE